MTRHHVKIIMIMLFVVAGIVAVYQLPPIAQNQAYMNYADQRSFFGIPNALNVLSNLPFALVGIVGFFFVTHKQSKKKFDSGFERFLYALFFVAIFIVTFCSSFHHWRPDNFSLMIDRLPMAVGFMVFLTAMVAERVSLTVAKWLFIPLVLLGLFSVLYWYFTQVAGHGDLRPYMLVQFFSMLVVLFLVAAFRSPYTGLPYLLGLFAWYLVAKIFETYDTSVYHLTGSLVSGHSLKHILAAIAVFYVYLYLRNRKKR